MNLRKIIRQILEENFGDNYDFSKHSFTTGDCDIYAVSLHRLHGYPLYVVRGWIKSDSEEDDEINYEDCHIVVKLPSGMFLDSRGEQSEMDLIQDARFMNDVYKVTVEPISEEIALSTFSCQDQESEIRQVMDYIRSKNIIKEEVERISEQTIDKLPNLSIGKTYEYNDLPEQIQDDIDVQFKIYGNDSEGDEWKLDGNPEDYQYHYILLPWKEIPKRLPLALGYIKKAHNSEYLQRIFKDIEQQGLQYPSVGEEGNHRGAYYYINKKDLPYLEIVQKKHFMNEADYTEINNNHKPLKKLLNSQEAYDILDSTAANGSTWTAGGCAILAFALNKAFGYPVYAIFDNDLNHVDHLVVKMPDGKFLDYDGANKNKLKSFKALEGLQGRNMSLIPFTSDMETSDIVFDSEASERLSDLIKDSGTINENRLNSDKYKGCSFSDLARMDLIDDFLKKSEIDPEYNLEDPELDWLLDAYEGYPDQVYIQNDVDNNRVVFWEGWSELCWEGLYAKPEYKGLSKEDSIKKIFKERIPRIAQEFEMKIVETDYFFHQTSDYSIDDGYIMRIVLSKKSQLSESVESDLEFQSQARRIYNKIVKNIDSVELKPLDEGDFVKTNKGIVQLEGVKFNLSQVDRNYNLDVYFARKFAKSNSIAHFDSKNNRLVFFILSDQDKGSNFETNQRFARLRFKSWVEPETFIHEFVHYLDSMRYSQSYKFKTPQTKSDYYNSPEELNAYYHEIASSALKNRKSFDKSFKSFLSGLLHWHQDFFHSLSKENKKKITNRLYKLWLDSQEKKNLNEEYYLDDENSLELALKLQKKLKLKELNLIGYGNNGFAYSIGDNKVMKITSDLSEYAEAMIIKGKKNKHLADVYAVYKLTGKYKNIAVIIVEKLAIDIKNIEILEEELYSIFNENFSNEFGYLSELLHEYQRGMVPSHKIDIVKKKLYSLLDEDVVRFAEQLFDLVGELRKNSMTTSDYSSNNLGYKKNGDLAYFDYGFGEIVPTEFKSKLNIRESASDAKFLTDKFTLDLSIIRSLLDMEKIKGKISAFDNYAWRLKSIIDSVDGGETLKVKDPKDGKIHEYSLADLYISDLKKMEDRVNFELGKIRELVGDFHYDSKGLVYALLNQEEFDADDIYPFPIYISADSANSVDEVGIMIHGNGKYEMFEENEESSPETDMMIKKILGLLDKKQRVFAAHNEQLVDQIRREKKLPANLYLTPYKDYAKSYWSSSEQRSLFSCLVNLSDIKMEGDTDWRTIREAPIEDFKFLGNI